MHSAIVKTGYFNFWDQAGAIFIKSDVEQLCEVVEVRKVRNWAGTLAVEIIANVTQGGYAHGPQAFHPDDVSMVILKDGTEIDLWEVS